MSPRNYPLKTRFMKVYVHCLTWNDQDYLPELLASLEAQTYKDFTLRVLDNGSTDGTVAFLQKNYPSVLVARNVKNKGYAPGHNQLLQFTMDHLDSNEADPYILIINSDMILHEGVVGTLVDYLNAHPEVHGVQPKLYRAFNRTAEYGLLDDPVKSDVIDTTGLRLKKSWRMVDRGAGELDSGQFDGEDARDIVAPTGTMAMYRLSTLKALMIRGEWFDGGFFAYREDCDFALRFKKHGYVAHFVPEAKAWHFRGMFGEEKMTAWQRLKNRKGQSPFTAALSTRNQLLVNVKHLGFGDLLRYGLWVVPAEASRGVYGFLFESSTRKMLFGMWPLLRQALRDRKAIRASQTESNSIIYPYVGK